MISATSITSMLMIETILMSEDESDNGVNEVVRRIWRISEWGSRSPPGGPIIRWSETAYLSSPSDWECEVARIALTRPVMQRGWATSRDYGVCGDDGSGISGGDMGCNALATHLARKLPSLPLSRRRCSASIPWMFGWNQRRLDILNLHFHFS